MHHNGSLLSNETNVLYLNTVVFRYNIEINGIIIFPFRFFNN